MLVKTAARTLDLFETFAEMKGPLGLSEIARRLGWPVSSCFGLVRTLEARGFVYLVSSRRGFYPTRRMLEQVTQIAAHDPLHERASPILSSLRAQTRETVLLGKLQQQKVVYLEVFESEQSIRYTARVGDLKPLHSSAMGKALLASLPVPRRKALLGRTKLPAVTPNTITDPVRLMAHLEEGQARGWQMTRSENVGDVMAVARTVELGGETYGVAVAGPVHRMEIAVDAHVRALGAACNQLGADHGRR
ncbi:MAG: IclR family transcriptional regulator [Beijerinckiaceae bacterium]